MSVYIGPGSLKEMQSCYVGVGGAAKSVDAIYVGVGGAAKLVWPVCTDPEYIYNLDLTGYSYDWGTSTLSTTSITKTSSSYYTSIKGSYSKNGTCKWIVTDEKVNFYYYNYVAVRCYGIANEYSSSCCFGFWFSVDNDKTSPPDSTGIEMGGVEQATRSYYTWVINCSNFKGTGYLKLGAGVAGVSGDNMYVRTYYAAVSTTLSGLTNLYSSYSSPSFTSTYTG